jgi:hypothetical protein
MLKKSYVKGTMGLPRGLHLQGLEANRSPSCGAEVKNGKNDKANHTHALMVCARKLINYNFI